MPAINRLKLPLAADREGTGDFAYTISPSIVLVLVLDIGDVLCEYCFELDVAVNGVTRSIDLAPYEELCGLVLGGSGREVEGAYAGVYGKEKLTDDAGVCDSDGAALKLTCDVDARLKRGRYGRTVSA